MSTYGRPLSRSITLLAIFVIASAAIVIPTRSLLRNVSAAEAENDHTPPTRHASTGESRALQPGGKPSQDGIWQEISEDLIPTAQQRLVVANKYRIFKLNAEALSKLVAQAPLEFSDRAKTASAVMTLPMPDGQLARFRIEDSPVLAPHLAAAFPSWKTLQAYGIDDPTAMARLDWTN